MSEAEWTVIFAAALNGRDGFWTGSYDSDRFGTARRLLAWRDALRMGGWAGSAAGGRIDALAALEEIVPSGGGARPVGGGAGRFTGGRHRDCRGSPDRSFGRSSHSLASGALRQMKSCRCAEKKVEGRLQLLCIKPTAILQKRVICHLCVLPQSLT